MQPVKLYGMMLSGNTGRVRSYFIHAGIPFRDIGPSTPHYVTKVVPQAGGIATMPTIELEDGTVIRDGVEIITQFENQTGNRFSPTAQKQRFLSRGFERQEETYLKDDEIPETLIDFLHVMAEDFVPETVAAAQTINNWIVEQDDLPADTPCDRSVGYAEFDVRGTKVSAIAQPYRFYLLKRVQDEFDAMSDKAKQAMKAIFDTCNMTPLLDATLTRGIKFKNNRAVWV